MLPHFCELVLLPSYTRISDTALRAASAILGGAGIGALLGLFLGRDSITFASVNPNTDLAVTLNSDLLL